MKCTEHTDIETLVTYWLGELPVRGEEALEEHLFACGACSTQLEALVALASGMRAVVKDGKVSMVVSAPFVDTMKLAGLSLREYSVDPGGSVNCTIRADDDAVISHLRAPLAGVKRLDVVSSMGGAEPAVRLADVPFDAVSGELVVIPSPAWLKSLPACTIEMRLLAIDGTEETPIGDYTFNHEPSRAAASR